MEQSEMVGLLRQEMKSLTDLLVDEDYRNAIDEAERETWSLPQSTNFKVKWIKKRAKRHIYSFLQAESANETQFGGIHLEHRFKHFTQLIENEDKAFEIAQVEYADEFADVDSYRLFGSVIDAGFQSEPQTGIDTTYTDDNQIIITPPTTESE